MNKLTQLRRTALLLCSSFHALPAQKWSCAAQDFIIITYTHLIMRKVRHFLGCMTLIIACLPTQTAFSFNFAQTYIAQYKDLAMQEQRLTGIPASIKLAMALLESGSGTSNLAVNGNNHFGIKWWNVAKDGTDFMEVFDDAKDEHGKRIASRFIKFTSVEASYQKHSEVLRRPRYQVLFTYPLTDYQAWAYGLETCGYATSKGYGARLIELIDRYNLTQYTLPEEPSPDVISFENTPTTTPKSPPQYFDRSKPIQVVSEQKKPVPTPVKPTIESHFINSQGQKMHYVLSEM